MASIIPKTRLGRIAFYNARLATWTTNATIIGTTTTAVTEVGTLLAAAETARAVQETAMANAKAKTAAFYAAVETLSDKGANIVKAIRVKGESTNNPQVWELSMIPAPAIPAPVGPPGQPYEPKIELNGDGALILKWKCNNPAGSNGTVYQVFRQIGGAGEFTYLGGAGSRKFIDNTIPAGATQLTYKIQAVRSTAIGMWAMFNVLFGTNAGGGMTATLAVAPAAPKLAA